jgi:hypothetical protein
MWSLWTLSEPPSQKRRKIEDDESNFHDFGIELKLPLNVAVRICNLRIIHKGGNDPVSAYFQNYQEG